MVMKKRPSLLSQAKSCAKQNYKKPTGLENWFVRLSRSHPKIAAELEEVAKDWLNGGETRVIFDKLTELHRFVVDTVPEVKDIKYATFTSWLKNLTV